MKNFIAKIMIFIIFFNFIGPFNNVIEIYGESLNQSDINKKNKNNSNKKDLDKIELTPSFTRSLTEGGVNTTPSDVMSPNIKFNTILVSMNIKDILDKGETTFYYLNSKDEKISFIIDTDKLGKYKARYEVYNWKNNNWERKDSKIEIYAGNSTTPKYYDVETYKKEYNSELHGITNDSTDKNVTFIFGKSKGFSFKDNGKIVHFRASSNGNIIDIVLSDIKEGYIYNFYAKAKGMKGHTSAFTGINTETFNSIPFSTNHMDEINDPSNNEVLDFKNDNYILNYKSGELTAKEEVGISLRFDEPMSLWIDSLGEGEPKLTSVSEVKDNNIEYSIETSIRMLDNRTGVSQNDQLKIKIKDLLKLNENPSNVEIEESAETKPKPSNEKDGSFVKLLFKSKNGKPGRIELRLNGLKSGTLFSDVEIESDVKLKSGENILTKSSKEIPFGKVFTFLDYKFIYRSNAFFIEVIPYKGIKGLYTLTMNKNIVLQQIGDPTQNVYLCLPVSTEEIYQVYFAPERNLADNGNTNLEKMAYSEKSIYKPDGSDMNFDAPTDFKIIDYLLKPLDSYPNPNLYGTEGNLFMKLKWSIGKSSDIRDMINMSKDKKLSVEYDIKKSLVAEKFKGVAFARLHLTIENKGNNIYEASYEVEDLKIKKKLDSGKYILEEFQGKYYITTEFEILAKRLLKELETEAEDLTFYYPRIYFLNVGVVGKSYKDSLFDSMTLDDILAAKLPYPYDLSETINTITKNSFGINWRHSGKELLEFMKNNSYSFEKGKLKFFVNLYISQDLEKMKELSKLTKLEDRKKYSVNFSFDKMGVDSISFAGEPISKLRKGSGKNNILRIEGYDLSKYTDDIKNGLDFVPKLILKDLDSNQKYYLNVSLGLIYESEDGTVVELESILSNLLGVTTKDEAKIPGSEDKVPNAPKIFIKDVGLDKATVFWKYVELPSEDNKVKIHYEVIRTRNKQIDSKYLNTKNDIKFYYDLLKKDMSDVETIFLRTNDNKNKDGKYVPDIFDGNNFKPSDISKFELKYENLELELLDNTLSSNQIYFYYVRTVRTVGGKVNYSVWNVENCTTSNLKSPINLIIDTDRNDYDPKSEFVIRFDAPIKNVDILGKEYILQYSIKEEDGEFSEPKTMDSSRLKSNASKSKIKDYTHFIYKIEGLKSGKNYTIRVRLASVINADASAYSNIASTRTDMSQDDYNKDKDVEKWTNYFDQELKKIIKDPYWVISDTKTEFIVVYRPSMVNVLMSSGSDANIELAGSKKEANEYIYYIPAKILMNVNGAEKGFKISLNNLEIIIPAKSFNIDINEDISSIVNEIKSKKIEDYYVKIGLKESKRSSSIKGDNPLTNKIDISFEVVGSITSNLKWDNDILESYLKEIDKQTKSNSIKNYISESITRKKSNEEKIKYIMERVENIKDKIVLDSKNSFNRILKLNSIIKKSDLDIMMIFKESNNEVIVKGYTLNSSLDWIETSTTGFGEYKGILLNAPGTYIFAGNKLVIPGLNNQLNLAKTISILSKYRLDDILGYNGFINTESLVTRDMFINIVARMIGASKDDNGAKFLSSKGYDITGFNNKGQISFQESIYLMMPIYEIRTNTKINTLSLRNNGKIDGINEIDPKYQKSVKVALELGLCNKNLSRAKDKVKIKELLEMLTNLDSKSRL